MANSTDSSTDSNGIYHYDPSKTAALIAAAVFGISAFTHLFQMIRKKTWFYTPMTVGAFSTSLSPHILFLSSIYSKLMNSVMTGGYGVRYLSAKSPNTTMLYAGQSLLILLPPSLYAATIYMIYGRLVLFVNAPSASIIRPTRVTKIFVLGDVLSFFIQAGGGGMMVQAKSASLGQKVILSGLFFQLLFFGFFLVIAIVFERRMMKSGMRYTIPIYGKHSWRALLLLLLSAAVVIIMRCLYRVVEFAQGQDGFLMGKEVFMYLGDAAPMFFVQTVFHFIHAGDVFPRGAVGKDLEENYITLPDRS